MNMTIQVEFNDQSIKEMIMRKKQSSKNSSYIFKDPMICSTLISSKDNKNPWNLLKDHQSLLIQLRFLETPTKFLQNNLWVSA